MKSFEKIYIEYSDRIFSFLYRLSSDKELSEELTQDTFCRAFASFSKFKGDSSIFTWLTAIAKYTYFSYMKKNKVLREALSFEGTEELESLVHSSDNTESDYERKELYQKLNELLYKLPDKYRDAVIYRNYADMSFKQISEIMKITENSAKVLYFRAKNMLKEGIENEYEM